MDFHSGNSNSASNAFPALAKPCFRNLASDRDAICSRASSGFPLDTMRLQEGSLGVRKLAGHQCVCQSEGYTLLSYSTHNTFLVLQSALDTWRRLQDWVSGWRCERCYRRWELSFTTNQEGCFCQHCIGDPNSGWWVVGMAVVVRPIEVE